MSDATARFPRLAPSVVERVCGRTHAARGRAIVARGDVLTVVVAEELGELMGLVLGTAPQPYVQRISLSAADGYANDCTCPVGASCKHVAAALHHYITHRDALARGETLERAPLDGWLRELADAVAASEAMPTDTPPPGGGVLLYRLDAPRRGGSAPFTVTPLRSRTLKAGGFGRESPARLSGYRLPDWCTDLDRDILRALDDLEEDSYHADVHARFGASAGTRAATLAGVAGTGSARLLRLLVESGRCFVGEDRTRALADGGPRALALGWEARDDGRLALAASLDNIVRWRHLPTVPPWYLDEVGHLCGPIVGAPPGPVLQRLLAAPALDPGEARRASELIAARLPGSAVPPPFAADAELVDASPVPSLTLGSRTGSDDPRDFVASLGMRYGVDTLAYEGERAAPQATLEDEDGCRVVRRRAAEEHERARELAAHCPGLEPLAPDGAVAAYAPPAEDIAACTAAWRTVLAALPALETIGWIIETRPPFGLDFARLDDVDAVVSETSHGWFELSLAMLHEGQRFALLPLIVEWLEVGEPERPILVRAESGAWLEIAPEIYRPVAETLTELFDHLPDGEALRLPTQRASLLEELEARWRDAGGGATWQGGERLFALAERLRRFAGIRRPELPDGVHAALRPYQHDGVAWLGFLAEYGFGGILADDMGLGKTLQTLAHVAVERASGRLDAATLVVAPTSLLGNWRREAERFVPDLDVVVWHGAERHERGLDAASAGLVVTSYALALRDVERLAAEPFGLLVLDEAQAIKNPGAKTTRALKLLPIERRLCLSGTPLENHLGELWSQFDFLMPGYLGSGERFARRFRTPIEKRGDDERQRRLNALTRPFLLRRKKEDVAADLPPKSDIVQSVTLGAEQARLYESIRLSMEARVKRLLAGKGLARSRIELLDALLKLRQTCCHPALVKLPSARRVHESAKTEQLLAMLDELVAEGRRVLVFSQFTTMLGLIAEALDARGLRYVKLTGRTRRRDAVVDAFQRGDVPLFLISLKAGGTGLNLTAADTVIHYDPWWNPAVEAQASARAHRIGQDKPVFVYRLVAADTVEERILEMQERKRRLADAAIDGGGATLDALSAEDMLGLFAARDA